MPSPMLWLPARCEICQGLQGVVMVKVLPRPDSASCPPVRRRLCFPCRIEAVALGYQVKLPQHALS